MAGFFGVRNRGMKDRKQYQQAASGANALNRLSPQASVDDAGALLGTQLRALSGRKNQMAQQAGLRMQVAGQQHRQGIENAQEARQATEFDWWKQNREKARDLSFAGQEAQIAATRTGTAATAGREMRERGAFAAEAPFLGRMAATRAQQADENLLGAQTDRAIRKSDELRKREEFAAERPFLGPNAQAAADAARARADAFQGQEARARDEYDWRKQGRDAERARSDKMSDMALQQMEQQLRAGQVPPAGAMDALAVQSGIPQAALLTAQTDAEGNPQMVPSPMAQQFSGLTAQYIRSGMSVGDAARRAADEVQAGAKMKPGQRGFAGYTPTPKAAGRPVEDLVNLVMATEGVGEREALRLLQEEDFVR